MNKLLFAIFAVIILPLRAEMAPIYEEVPTENDTEEVSDTAAVTQDVTVQDTTIQRAATAPIMHNIGRQGATSRAVSSRTGSTSQVRTTSDTGRPISSRTTAIQNRVAEPSSRSHTIANAIVNGRQNDNRNVAARSGTLFNPTSGSVNSARVGVTTSSVTTGGTRSVSARASTAYNAPTLFNSGSSTTKTTSSGNSAEELAAQTDFCKAQYSGCMDNFCAALDDNQGRCTCSASITKYQKTEDALKEATISLQDIATKIKYLGLSKDEVTSLFSQTAAEEAMGTSNDNSVLKSSLDNIQKLLIDPKTATVSTGGLSSVDFSSLDFGNGFDMNSFLNDGESISNQRGDALFNTAKTRCASFLTYCKNQGVDQSMVTANYDLEIDKQCISYERSLIDQNDKMKETIRNATTVLQQARLMVSQNKNKYDLKGCVNALDSCMVDDFVCGDGYQNCLDVSGQYIVGGNIVTGSSPSTTIGSTGFIDNWKYGTKNAFYGTGPTAGTLNEMVDTSAPTDNNLIKLLKGKVGTIDSEGKATGMCSSILNQCQSYTYSNNTYQADNAVIKEFLTRTLVNIKAKQDSVMSAYGESCRQDIISCFVKNGATSTRPTQFQETIAKSCLPYVKTCAAVNNITAFDGDVASYVCPIATPKLTANGTGCQS